MGTVCEGGSRQVEVVAEETRQCFGPVPSCEDGTQQRGEDAHRVIVGSGEVEVGGAADGGDGQAAGDAALAEIHPAGRVEIDAHGRVGDRYRCGDDQAPGVTRPVELDTDRTPPQPQTELAPSAGRIQAHAGPHEGGKLFHHVVRASRPSGVRSALARSTSAPPASKSPSRRASASGSGLRRPDSQLLTVDRPTPTSAATRAAGIPATSARQVRISQATRSRPVSATGPTVAVHSFPVLLAGIRPRRYTPGARGRSVDS